MATVESIIYVCLESVFVIPLSVLWFISLCNARRRNDPARTGVAWMKAAFPFWIWSMALGAIAGGIGILVEESYYSLGRVNRNTLRRAANHVARTASFLGMLADILLFITFVELAVGFLLCLRPEGTPSRARKPARTAIFVGAFVLFALSLASFGVGHAYLVQVYTSASAGSALGLDLIKLSASIAILLWITSIPILGLASYVVSKTSSFELLHNPAVLLLVATVLNFVRLTAKMGMLIHFNLASPTAYAPVFVFDVIYTIFDNVFMFIALVLLFTLAIRKHRGLWSKPQPGWSYPGPGVVYVPAMMAVPVAGPGGVVMQPQQQPLQYQQPDQNLPAYLQVAQQKQQQQMMQQPQYGQPMAAPQGYYYPPQQQQQQQQQQPVTAPAPAVAAPQPAVTTA